jgi:hypothetical protein
MLRREVADRIGGASVARERESLAAAAAEIDVAALAALARLGRRGSSTIVSKHASPVQRLTTSAAIGSALNTCSGASLHRKWQRKKEDLTPPARRRRAKCAWAKQHLHSGVLVEGDDVGFQIIAGRHGSECKVGAGPISLVMSQDHTWLGACGVGTWCSEVSNFAQTGSIGAAKIPTIGAHQAQRRLWRTAES